MYTISQVSQEIESNLKTTPKRRWENNKLAITTLQELQSSGESPTNEQLIALSPFNGWGSIAPIFGINPSGWEQAAQTELRQLLGEDEYNNAAASTLNAHYTDPAIIRSIWDVIHKTGFKSGTILEPACGTGLFFAGMKAHYRDKSDFFGVEIDKTAAAIAQHLYPSAIIHNTPFESCQFPDGYFDFAVSNVPFGSFSISDTRYDHLGLKIHNYFLAKCSDLVRVGGLVGIITSSYTLDAPGSQRFREWLDGKLKLLTAFRLPNDAFKGIANTEVTTDFLLFQKVAPTQPNETTEDSISKDSARWLLSRKVTIDPQNWQGVGDGETTEAYLNQYYYNEFNGRKYDKQYTNLANSIDAKYWKEKIYTNVHHLLGIPSVNKLYGDGFALLGDGRDISDAIDAIKIEKCYVANDSKSDIIVIPPELQNVKQMAFCLHNGKVYQRQRYNLVKVKNLEIGRIESFWRLREVTVECLNAQSTCEDITPFQQKLRREYESFIYKWGKTNDKKNIEKLGSDPNYYLVRGLEKRNSDTVADIFHKRVCSYVATQTTATNIHDAIALSLSNRGGFSVPYITSLLGVPVDEVTRLLEEENLAYFNPTTDKWELKDAYLSGNIYEKLQVAESNQLTRNIAALQATLPMPMLPNATSNIKFACIQALGIEWDALDEAAQQVLLKKHINATLGAGWINRKYYEQFALEVMRVKAKIARVDTSSVSYWVVNGHSRDTIEYGTGHLNSAEILEKAINNQDPRVTILDEKKEVNIDASNRATEEARNKATIVKRAFADWIWSDEQRCIDLCLHYNQTINVYADRKYDGSYLKLPGINPEITLRSWQRNAIVRIIECNSTFVGHDVGYGKSFTLISAIMECRRLGLAKRPILVALNGTEQQLFADWKRLYPTANVLLPTSMNADGRKYFSAALASADFDGIILTHSQYFALALSKEYQLEFLNDEKATLRDYLQKVKKNDRGAAKQIQRALQNIEHRISKVTSSERKDNHIDFEDLRVDLIAIDEIQMFKNLSVVTKLNNVKGIQTNYSQRAIDNYMKMLHVIGNTMDGVRRNNGKIIGATGTVISNSLCEVYTWLRIFAAKQLSSLGITAFDKFMSYFGITSTGAEISASGQYKVVTRFKSFCNLQPLRALCKQFLDIVNEHTHPEAAAQLEIPQTKYIDVCVQPSEAQLKFLSNAFKRATDIKEHRVDPKHDNWLWLTTDFNKCALSERLIGEPHEAPGSKLHECAWNVWQIWKASLATKRTQLIFCDYSTPKPDRYNVYHYMKLLLTALGIPDSQIAFVHDYDAESRPQLYKLIEQGKVRVLLGSTSKLGTGCNVHKRGIEFVHHLDGPWRPSDMKQRDGRAKRQGNGGLFGTKAKVRLVTIFRYITERLDALRWQALATKQAFIEEFFNGCEDEIENCEDIVYSYNQVKSLATGNPLLVEEANLRNELNTLLSQLRSHEQQQFSLSYEQKRWESKVINTKYEIELVNSDIENTGAIPPILERTQIESQLTENRRLVSARQDLYPTLLGTYRNFNVYGQYDVYKKEVEIRLSNNASHSFKDSNIRLRVSQLLDSIDELIAAMPNYVSQLHSQLEDAKVEVTRCQSLVGRQFQDTDRINEVKHRLDDIEAIMAEFDSAIAFDSNDEADTIDETGDEESETDEFWLAQDRSFGCTTLNQSVVDMLQARSTENVEWLFEYIVSTNSGQVADEPLDKSSLETKVKNQVEAHKAIPTKQLSLFNL